MLFVLDVLRRQRLQCTCPKNWGIPVRVFSSSYLFRGTLLQGQIFVLKFFLLTQANYSICLFFHGVVSLNLYFDAKIDF